MRYLEHILPTGIIEANVIKPMTPKRYRNAIAKLKNQIQLLSF